MAKGLWVVFEGPDGVGKSTTMQAVAVSLRKRLPDIEIVETKHPGSTPLGKHIRELVKHPERFGFEIDPLSSQMLMFTDHINFKNTLLQPALDRGAIVLADRCDLVSGLVYGAATGLDQSQINALMQLACVPRIDLLYILRCSRDVQEQRLSSREVTDRFEAENVRSRVNQAYERLMTSSTERTILVNRIVALDNIKYVESDQSLEMMAARIAGELGTRYTESMRGD